MKLPRISLFKLMAAVALIAVDFAAFRFVMDYDPDLMVCALSGLVLQVGIFLAIRCRNRARAFWVGFVAFGAFAAFSCYYGLVVDTESTATAVWYEYLGLVAEFTGINLFATGFTIPGAPPSAYNFLAAATKFEIVFTLPQLIVAFLGGLIAFAVACIKQSCGRALAALDNRRARTRSSPRMASRRLPCHQCPFPSALKIPWRRTPATRRFRETGEIFIVLRSAQSLANVAHPLQNSSRAGRKTDSIQEITAQAASRESAKYHKIPRHFEVFRPR